MIKTRLLFGICASAALATLSYGAAIVPVAVTTADGRNDDGTYITGGCTNPANHGNCGPGTAVNLGYNINFFGVPFSSVFINTNGNVTLGSGLNTYTPFGLVGTASQIIAPFFADVDTRNAGSGVTTFGFTTFGGNSALAVNWINVGYFNSHADKTNSFQLLLVNRGDTGAGNFDVVFNYDKIQWETGDASGGSGGLGGTSAAAGFSNGTGAPGTSFQLTGSLVPGALLDGGPNALITHSLNSTVAGQYIFFGRNGTISGGTPEPGTFAMLGLGLVAAYCWRRKKSLS